MGKYIGIDYGTKKTGIAVSDTAGTVAFPREVLVTDRHLPERIAEIVTKEDICGIVIGASKNLTGELNAVAQHAQVFAEQLKHLVGDTVQIEYEDERFTTRQARMLPNEHVARGVVANTRKTIRNGKNRADAHAAAIILQSFLDKRKNMR